MKFLRIEVHCDGKYELDVEYISKEIMNRVPVTQIETSFFLARTISNTRNVFGPKRTRTEVYN